VADGAAPKALPLRSDRGTGASDDEACGIIALLSIF